LSNNTDGSNAERPTPKEKMITLFMEKKMKITSRSAAKSREEYVMFFSSISRRANLTAFHPIMMFAAIITDATATTYKKAHVESEIDDTATAPETKASGNAKNTLTTKMPICPSRRRNAFGTVSDMA
jgi:hypothetical protein